MSGVILLDKKLDVLDEPLINLPKPSEIQILGTKSSLLKNITASNQEKIDKFKQNAHAEHKHREDAGEGGCWYEIQHSIVPKVDSSLVGLKIKMIFSYMEMRWIYIFQLMLWKSHKYIEWKEQSSTDYFGWGVFVKMGYHVVQLQAYEKWNPKNKKHNKWELERIYD